MNVARDMLIGAGFTIVNENGNMANVEIGGNAAVLVMDDPERDPIGKCKVITDDAEIEFDTIYDAAAYVDGIGKNTKEIHYFYERYIVVNPDIKCVFAHNDEMALGAIEAIGDKEIIVAGFDATDDAVEAVKEGRMAATVAQQPDLMGATAVETAGKLIKGESVEKTLPVEVSLITKDNAK